MLRISVHEDCKRQVHIKADQMTVLNRELPKLLRKVFRERLPHVVIDIPVIVVPPKAE